jgi:hypothetical protein
VFSAFQNILQQTEIYCVLGLLPSDLFTQFVGNEQEYYTGMVYNAYKNADYVTIL